MLAFMDPQIVPVVASPIAVVRHRVRWADLPAQVPTMLDTVYAAHTPGRQGGHTVIVYLSTGAEGADLLVGVPTDTTFTGSGTVQARALPQGQALWVSHTGPIDEMRATHAAVVDYAQANGIALANVSWELYADWDQDPAQLQADVFHLLA